MDLSIVLPCYKRSEEFAFALQYNHTQYAMAKEVIIIFDEIIEDYSKYNFLFLYPNINFVFYINKENHSWRNPAVVINKGLEYATSTYCLVMSPESILLENVIQNLYKNVNEQTFCCGSVVFITKNKFLNLEEQNQENKDATAAAAFLPLFHKSERKQDKIGPVFFGSLLCSKENFVKAGYYSSRFRDAGWGGEDDDIRVKLQNIGLKKMHVLNAKIIHVEGEKELDERFTYKNKERKIDQILSVKAFDHFTPCSYTSFQLLAQKKRFLESKSEFLEFEIHKNIPSKAPILLLCQCYNESKYIREFLQNVSGFVDGIVVLDDESTDNSWDLLQSDKIWLKAKKKRCGTFHDLNNRNLLYQLFHYLQVDVQWIVWLDLDEQIYLHQELSQLRKQMLEDIDHYDIYKIPLVQMWNNTHYNSNYPYSERGVQMYYRIIRNKHEHHPFFIKSHHILNFNLCPYHCPESRIGVFPLLLKHLGRISEEVRMYKYHLYMNIERTITKNTSSMERKYQHFLENNVRLESYETNKDRIFSQTRNKFLMNSKKNTNQKIK